MDPFTGQPDPEDVTLRATVVGPLGDGWDLDGEISDSTDVDSGVIRIRVSDSARAVYGLQACADAIENRLNRLPAKVRLAAALGLGKYGAYEVVTTADTGPYVIVPEPTVEQIAIEAYGVRNSREE